MNVWGMKHCGKKKQGVQVMEHAVLFVFSPAKYFWSCAPVTKTLWCVSVSWYSLTWPKPLSVFHSPSSTKLFLCLSCYSWMLYILVVAYSSNIVMHNFSTEGTIVNLGNRISLANLFISCFYLLQGHTDTDQRAGFAKRFVPLCLLMKSHRFGK